MAKVRVFNPSRPTRENWFGFGRSREAVGDPKPGDLVKVRFTQRGESERMWVQVTGKRGRKYTGILDNEPVVVDKRLGDRVSFSKSRIVGNNPTEVTTTRRRSNSMQRTVRSNQQQATSGAAGTAIAKVTATQDALRKENERLKQKVETMQDTLDEIADVASAPADGSELDSDELATKLDTILDLAAPGSCDDTDQDDADDLDE
jgi:hypothetical protein